MEKSHCGTAEKLEKISRKFPFHDAHVISAGYLAAFALFVRDCSFSVQRIHYLIHVN